MSSLFSIGEDELDLDDEVRYIGFFVVLNDPKKIPLLDKLCVNMQHTVLYKALYRKQI